MAMKKLSEVGVETKSSTGSESNVLSTPAASLKDDVSSDAKKSLDNVLLQLQKHPLYDKIKSRVPENVTNGELVKLIQDPLLKLNGYWSELTATPPKERLVKIGKIINEVTGYSAVEELKNTVIHAEKNLLKAKEQLEEVKLAYEKSIEERATCQRDINNLLQRKHTWVDEDVVKFTNLYRSEHINEQAEEAAKARFKEYEKNVDHRHNELVDAIRMRYHEEQIWSDKIRGASTYGTWALMGIHVCLFILVQTIFEPKKRRRLQEHFDKKLAESSEEELLALSQQVQPVIAAVDNQQARIDSLVEEYSKLQDELKALTTQISSSNDYTRQPTSEYIAPLAPPPNLTYNELNLEHRSVDAKGTESSLPESGALDSQLSPESTAGQTDEAFAIEMQAAPDIALDLTKGEVDPVAEPSLEESVVSTSQEIQAEVDSPPVYQTPGSLAGGITSFYDPHVIYQYTQKDVALLSLESAVAGGLITAIIAYLLNR
ncbi:hypothetical protein K493DRAFT_320750 [Basidiobolus meristosporus CBS 931.73]|uniref:Sensitive to high expression protein 9, mitochondrial n=1 Tax=Basidiobolus meristosporus CBS 931.73 TaxID=1314790 RepID=A0A1Y1X6Z9_9FUNG|nr:hypothetical protein K493DRAFT_320750 [Basidiobolus meristosporus CBS 931.73]|eukprot:ORX81104.1 hypothetical protein K493DRAFT_320750 [Basidiobolus meristosporus CBS 931.73]